MVGVRVRIRARTRARTHARVWKLLRGEPGIPTGRLKIHQRS